MIRPLVIAHRGASGYLPEHTLAAKGLAHDMGADFLEQDVVASRDDELIVLHDIHLDRVTDVAKRFPGRSRDDGRFYVRDFDLPELSSLRVWERMNADGSPVYPERYPSCSGDFRIHTLREELAFIRRLNDETGRQAGIYPEIKRPAWHRQQGIDVAPRVLEILDDFGYEHAEDPVFLQCFDDVEVRRLKHELGCPFKLVQLIGNNCWQEADTDYDGLRTADGIKRLAETVNAIGPHLSHLYEVREVDGELVPTGLAELAHDAGLAVHPYTFRRDEMTPGFTSFADLVHFFAVEIGVDAVFTDFPDEVLQLSFP